MPEAARGGRKEGEANEEVEQEEEDDNRLLYEWDRYDKGKGDKPREARPYVRPGSSSFSFDFEHTYDELDRRIAAGRVESDKIRELMERDTTPADRARQAEAWKKIDDLNAGRMTEAEFTAYANSR